MNNRRASKKSGGFFMRRNPQFAKNLQGVNVQTVHLYNNNIGDEMQASLKRTIHIFIRSSWLFLILLIG
jgi:hypothetical protein